MRGWENEVDINLQLHPHLIKQNSNTLFFIKKIVHGLLNFFYINSTNQKKKRAQKKNTLKTGTRRIRKRRGKKTMY